MEWNKFAEERPAAQGLYWFRSTGRRPKVRGDHLIEWVDEVMVVGMGYSDNELWPIFSHWDGYNRTIYPGTEWRPAEEGVKRHDVVIPSLKLLPGPFSGRAPRIRFESAFIGACPLEAPTFWLESCGGMARTGRFYDLDRLAAVWNERAPVLEPA